MSDRESPRPRKGWKRREDGIEIGKESRAFDAIRNTFLSCTLAGGKDVVPGASLTKMPCTNKSKGVKGWIFLVEIDLKEGNGKLFMVG